jgi:hypothetical protein
MLSINATRRRSLIAAAVAATLVAAAPAAADGPNADLRSPDARDAAAQTVQDLRSPDARDAFSATVVSPKARFDLRSADGRDGRHVVAGQVAATPVASSDSSSTSWVMIVLAALGSSALLFGAYRVYRAPVRPLHS